MVLSPPMTLLRSFLAGAALAAAGIAVHAQAWTDNYEAALAQAKASHKLILLNFTGSDWNPWCVAADKEIFQTPAFRDYAEKNLILLKVDFLMHHPQSDEVKAFHNKLAAKYGVTGYPTLIAIDGNEKVIFTQIGFTGTVSDLVSQFPTSTVAAAQVIPMAAVISTTAPAR